MIKPTKTINRIHFSDLNDKRFEDLCNSIIYPLHPWETILHIGRTGNDSGVDIRSVERLEDGTKREWFIQCKRYQKINKGELIKIIDEALKNTDKPPDILLVIVSCDISKKNIDTYFAAAKEKGIKEPMIWMASNLEGMLYNHRQDLLFTYFGISLAVETQKKEGALKRNINLKNRIYHDFRKYGFIDFNCYLDVNNKHLDAQEVIIHSIDDIDYPDGDSFKNGVSSWYKGYFCGFYHNGLEVSSYLVDGLIDNFGNWAIYQRQDYDKEKYKEILLVPCLRIPFKNIITYDMLGDEYYYCPHIYCRYSEGGQPHENAIYRSYSPNKYMPMLDDKKRFYFT